MTKYSICIPTRERHVTLRSAIETALAQTYSDFELIIQDNFSSPETRAVVDSFNDARIRYFRSERRLPMHDNWEEALSRATGDYILFIGDDDAVMPDCLARADAVIAKMDPDVLAWTNHLYYWPDVPDPAHRNLLIADVRNGSIWRDGYADDPFGANISDDYPGRPAGTLVFDGRRIAKAWYAWKGVRLYIPLYHNLVARRVVDRVRARCGRYFLDPTPDFASLAVNAYFSKNVVFYSRSLSMSGHSGRSNGGTHGNEEALNDAFERFLEEADIGVSDLLPAGLPSIRWSPTVLFGCFEQVRRRAFADDTEIPDGIKEFIKYAATVVEAELDVSTREQGRQWVLGMADRHGIPHSELKFTPGAPFIRPSGATNDPAGRVFYINVDGNSANLSTIADAVRLASNFSIQTDFPIEVRQSPSISAAILSELSHVEFNTSPSHGGNGLLAQFTAKATAIFNRLAPRRAVSNTLKYLRRERSSG